MEKLDEESAQKFISALIKSVQTLCHGYLNFQDGVEIIGHINLSVDRGSRQHYILEEKVCKNEENSTLFISNSFHAENKKHDAKLKGKDSQNVPSGNQVVQRHDSSDNEGGTVSSAISSIATALTGSNGKVRTGSDAKDLDSSHSKPNTAKRKASDDNDVRPAKSSHLSSSPSPVSHFLSNSPRNQSGASSPTDAKPCVSRLHSESGAEGDGGEGDLNLAGSVLERVDDHSNSDLPDQGDDSDGDLEVTFIKEEFVEGEQSSCQYENAGGQFGSRARQRGSSESMSDPSLYPVSLHHSAPATFVPSAHDMSSQHYGPSTSSSQPGTSGSRGPEEGERVDQGRNHSTLPSLAALQALSSFPSRFAGPSKQLQSRHRLFSSAKLGRPPLSALSSSLLGERPPLSASALMPGTSSSSQSKSNLQCDICALPFSTVQGLKRHRDSKHFNRTPYTCHVCGRGFTIKGHFEGHMNMHNNVKSFQCQKCPRAFAHRSSLRFHLRNSVCGSDSADNNADNA